MSKNIFFNWMDNKHPVLGAVVLLFVFLAGWTLAFMSGEYSGLKKARADNDGVIFYTTVSRDAVMTAADTGGLMNVHLHEAGTPLDEEEVLAVLGRNVSGRELKVRTVDGEGWVRVEDLACYEKDFCHLPAPYADNANLKEVDWVGFIRSDEENDNRQLWETPVDPWQEFPNNPMLDWGCQEVQLGTAQETLTATPWFGACVRPEVSFHIFEVYQDEAEDAVWYHVRYTLPLEDELQMAGIHGMQQRPWYDGVEVTIEGWLQVDEDIKTISYSSNLGMWMRTDDPRNENR